MHSQLYRLLVYLLVDINIYIYNDVMKTIQCAHPPHHHNGLLTTCPLWTANCGVHAFLVLDATECSKSTRLGA